MSEITHSIADKINYFEKLLQADYNDTGLEDAEPESEVHVEVISRAPLTSKYERQKKIIADLEAGKYGGIPAEPCHAKHIFGQLASSLELLITRKMTDTRKVLLSATRSLIGLEVYTTMLKLKDKYREGEFKYEDNTGMGAKGFFPEITDALRKDIDAQTGFAHRHGEALAYILRSAQELLRPSEITKALKPENDLPKVPEIPMPTITPPQTLKNDSLKSGRFKFEE